MVLCLYLPNWRLGYPGLRLLCLYVKCWNPCSVRISQMSCNHISLEWELQWSLQAHLLRGCFILAAQSLDIVALPLATASPLDPQSGPHSCAAPANTGAALWCSAPTLSPQRVGICCSQIALHSLLELPHYTDLEGSLCLVSVVH